MINYCVITLASAVHTTPARMLFSMLIWVMRAIALYAFCTDTYLLILEDRNLSEASKLT
jgi:hypothetical protein